MRKNEAKFTTAQFAGLHGVNKRTLHYYDNIGLFSPQYKGENGYRYYNYDQSMEFEFIRMLKELHLSIEEVKAFTHSFDTEKFLQVAEEKKKEMDEEIRRLKRSKRILGRWQKQILLCREVAHMEVRVEEFSEEHLLTLPYKYENDDFTEAFRHIQKAWKPEQCRLGVGSYLPVSRVMEGRYEEYEGLFSPMIGRKPGNPTLVRPAGKYLCGYCKGTWERLPDLYEKILEKARREGFSLTGYAYEIGLNDIAVSGGEDYVTQVAVRIGDICSENQN